MEAVNTITALYKPVQPTVKQSDENVSYRERPPNTSLQNVIHCYWQLKTSRPLLSPFHYRVVADGCIDIFFDITRPTESFVMGFCKKYTEFPLAETFNYVGIRFLPSMFPHWFKISAATLTNRYEKLELIHRDLARFIEAHLSKYIELEGIANELDEHFIRRFSEVSVNPDPRFYRAVELILESSGTIETERSLSTGVSARQLRRIFNYYIGTTPKTFSQVVRFQCILRAKPSVQSLRSNKIFYDIGFFDQSHFIKDFKNFYGVTPTRAFR